MKTKRLFKGSIDPLVILFFIILLSTAATYFIPAGVYERFTDAATGKTLVNPDSFTSVPQSPVSIINAMGSIHQGIVDAGSLVVYIILLGGSFGIISATGALNGFIEKIAQKFYHRRKLIVAFIAIFLSVCAGIFGMSSEMLVLIPILTIMCIRLGYDAIVAVAITIGASSAGYGSAPINPFTVGVAQQIADLPQMSGMGFRWIFWAITTGILVWYVLRYAEKVKKDPAKSLVKHIDYSNYETKNSSSSGGLTAGHIRVLIVFFITFIYLIFASLEWGLNFTEISTLFLSMGIIGAIVYRMSMETMVKSFVDGAKEFLYPALCVGFAQAVMIVLSNGKILDTIIHALVSGIQHLGLPSYIVAALMVPLQAIISLLIPSGAGQAVVTMPILVPIADLLHINRQVVVLAYQTGDGFFNAIVPTFGTLMAALVIARIPYTKWVAYVWKLILIQMILSVIAIIVAVKIGLGPF